ncbi:ubiquinol-cytochrome C chaperone-domain-containing protein [Dipodascopsis uninucleata]
MVGHLAGTLRILRLPKGIEYGSSVYGKLSSLRDTASRQIHIYSRNGIAGYAREYTSSSAPKAKKDAEESIEVGEGENKSGDGTSGNTTSMKGYVPYEALRNAKLPEPNVRTSIDPNYDPYAGMRFTDASKSLAELSGVTSWKAKAVIRFMQLFRMDVEENQAAPIAGQNYMELCKLQAYHPPGQKDYSLTAKFYYGELGLKPTMNQWFQITSLHVWMLLVRMRALPEKYAKTYQQALVDGVFLDIEYRIVNEYKIKSGRLISNSMKELNNQLRGSIFAYDEGLMGSDAVLGAALWRNMFGGNKDVDLKTVEMMVRYVRSHIFVLEKMSDFDFGVGRFVFIPPWIEQTPETIFKFQPPPLPSTLIFPGYESKFRTDN